VPPREAETPAAHSDASIDQPEEPATADPVEAPEPGLPQATPAQPAAVAPHVPALPQAPFVVANAEPASAQPPAPAIAAPVVLAPTIDAIELDGIQSFVSGSGPAGALMRLYADGQLIGESPVEEGRWLVEGSNLLDSPRRELRVEAIEPDTGKLLGVAAITVEIELPDGGAPPDERPEQTPDLGSGVAPAPQADPASPLATSPPTTAQPSSTDPADASAVADNELVIAPAPAAEPADQPTLVDDPEATAPKPAREPQIAAVEPEFEPEPLPPLASVRPQRESASVEILAPSTLQPTTLPPAAAGADDASTITLPVPDTPALIAEFDVPVPAPAVAPGQPVTILRLLPFGDPDEGRYNVGKAIIRRGDTLWSIARRYYGHGIHYRTIFHANRELIRRPSRIFPGQIFDLPLVTDD
jgi:nucleoid-associated protein YgaU